MRLVLADVDPVALEGTVADHQAAGTEVLGVPTDVSDAGAVDALAAAAPGAFRDRARGLQQRRGVGSRPAELGSTRP